MGHSLTLGHSQVCSDIMQHYIEAQKQVMGQLMT